MAGQDRQRVSVCLMAQAGHQCCKVTRMLEANKFEAISCSHAVIISHGHLCCICMLQQFTDLCIHMSAPCFIPGECLTCVPSSRPGQRPGLP